MTLANYPPSRLVSMDAHNYQEGKPTVYPVYPFEWANDTDFTPPQRELIAAGIASMSNLGPTCPWFTDGIKRPNRIIVGRFPDDNSTRPGPARTGDAGMTEFLEDGTMIMRFDMAGLHGNDAIFRASQHETGHVFMGPGLPLDGHIPLSHAVAVMNPNTPEMQFKPLPEGAQPMGDTMSMSGGGHLLWPVQADFDLFDHAVPSRAARLRAAFHAVI